MRRDPDHNQDREVVLAEDARSLPPVTSLASDGRSYRLGHQIGRGVFSTVYGAVDSWGNAIAMKVAEPSARHLWEREAFALRHLAHRHVVYLHSAFEHDGLLYLALERCGISAARIRLASTELRKACLHVARGLLQALDHVHRRGFVHGDVCPNNVLVMDMPRGQPPRVKLADFAFALPMEKLASAAPMQAAWQPCPERVDESRFGAPGPATDVYFASLTLLQLLSGEQGLYTAEEAADGRPRADASGLDDALGAVLGDALAPRAADRPSAAQLWARMAAAAGVHLWPA